MIIQYKYGIERFIYHLCSPMVDFLALDRSSTEIIDFMALDTSMEYIKAAAAIFLFFLGYALFSKVAQYVFAFVFGLLILGFVGWLCSEIGHEHITGWWQVIGISIGAGGVLSLALTPFAPILDMEKDHSK